MTSNQISNREITIKEKQFGETVRSNLVQESLKRAQIAEEVSNNLRNYKINLSKNKIQALANDQLNSRELQKLAETIRNNLAKELETNRANLSNEEIKRIEAANLTIGKAGKYSPGAVLAAVMGLMPADELERLYGKSNSTTKVKDSSRIDSATASVKLPDWNNPSEVIKFVRDSAQLERLIDEQEQKDKQDYVARQQEAIKYTHKEAPTGHNASRRGKSIYGHSKSEFYGREGEREPKGLGEIPTDYSNSFGPSVGPIPNLSVPSSNGKVSSSPHGTTSGGTDYHVSGGLTSKGVIYA